MANIGNLQNKSGDLLFPATIQTVNNTNGTALKFPDGTMICTQRISFNNVAQNFAWGSLYRTDYLPLPNYPVAFVEVKARNITANGGGLGWGSPDAGSLTSAGKLFLVQPNSTANISVTVDVVAIGRWK